MEIAWAEFTPVASFGGGAMIGVAALFLMLLNGRIMGMSGILSGLLVKLPDWPWRLAFVIGVIAGPFIFMAVTGVLIECQTVMSGPLVYVAAFLVGFGIGWGLAGYCPGPVVASLLLLPAEMLPFLVTLLAGAFIGRWLRS